MRRAITFSLLILTASARPDWQFMPGGWEKDMGPDGNSVLIDAPEGLIVVDTGRHPAHQSAILAAARARNRPIAAIVNTHWHLDHTGGNAELRAAFPRAEIIGSNAVERALTGFLPRSRAAAAARIASGKASPDQVAETRRDMAAMDDLATLRPTRIVARTGPMQIAGRRLDMHLAPYAATAGDVWLYDRRSKLLVAGDLVVGLAPFMDTACPDGWRKALAGIAAVPFVTLIPGHGAPMSRQDFTRWRKAFGNLLDCGASAWPREHCIQGWMDDAAPFVSSVERKRVRAMIGYYIDTRLRAAPAEKARFCQGGSG
jgi:glyoxylase-like metal-dependent hydrolase (beta-lactamase superfamily II)